MKLIPDIKDKRIESWYRTVSVVIMLLWSIILISLCVWNYNQQITSMYKLAYSVARDSYSKDLLFREWATGHGGVYVPVTPSMQPNKYLLDIPERDIQTLSGRKLTLINPAYMMRQVYELGEKEYGIRGHITSLNPIRAENAPDDWERKSLLIFEKKGGEAVIISPSGNQKFFRLMRPVFTKTGCLKCHAKQGYKAGDIRGGISISIPWDPFQEAYKNELRILIAVYGGIWVTGLLVILFSMNLIRIYLTERRVADKQISALLKEKELLLKEVHHRIKNNMNTIKGLLLLQASELENPLAAAALHDAENRVQSMMILYDKLYCSPDFSVVSVKSYMEPLLEEIIENFPNSGIVKVEMSITDFPVDANIMFPLGIIINEIITNMMKYAFAGRESGRITVRISKIDMHVVFEIKDNGIGISRGEKISKSSGFGMQLVSMLTEQIGGTLRIEQLDGTEFILEFDL